MGRGSASAPRRWPWLIVGMVVVVVLGVGWVVRLTAGPARDGEPRPDGWAPYLPADRAYRVVGPAEPAVQSAATELGTQRAVRFDAPDGEILAVESLDLLPEVAADASERDLVSGWANRLLGQLDGVIDERDILRAGSHPGVALRVDDGERRIVVRVFAAGAHLYEVAAVVPDAAPRTDRALAERFVGSFALTG